MVETWSFPFWGWPILKVSLHVTCLPSLKKNGSAKVKLRFCAWWSCICPLGRPGFVDGNQKCGKGKLTKLRRRSVEIRSGCTIPGGCLFGISEPSTVWCRYDEVLIFVYRRKWSWRKSGEDFQDQDSLYFFPIEVHCRWCGDASKNLVGQKPTDGGCNGGLSEGIDTKSIEAGGHVTWLHSLWLHWGR